MPEKKIPFYAQAAVIDEFIKSSNPAKNPKLLKVVLNMLETRADLKNYFFQNSPNPSWADIFLKNGLLKNPPSIQIDGDKSILPHWYEQEFLVSVAKKAQEVVIEHVKIIEGDGWYISRAINALCQVDTKISEKAVDRIIEWLKHTVIALKISSEVFKLIKKFAFEAKSEASLDLFYVLTAPEPPEKVKEVGKYRVGTNAVSKFRNDLDAKKYLAEGLNLLAEIDAQRLSDIFEKNLIKALKIESTSKNQTDYIYTSNWRSAIEDTDQDLHPDYKGRLLLGLRDSIEKWIQIDTGSVKPLLIKYLNSKMEILRRLALYILRKHPSEFPKELGIELLRKVNLDDSGIHHEYFMLLRDGFKHLDPLGQKQLIDMICAGPPIERSNQLAKWAHENYGADEEEYIQNRKKSWVRDRLWMLKDNLSGQQLKLLNDMVAELGEPQHPAFTRWHSGAYWVRDVSPIDKEMLSEKTAEQLVNFLEQWKPTAGTQFGQERVSYEGLANDVAILVVGNPEKYAEQLVQIALYRSEFAVAILAQFTKDEKASIAPWELRIELCEKLLENDSIRQSMSREAGETWVWARKRIVDLLEEGIKKPERAIPLECLPRVRDILLLLSDDPDPDIESDRPKEGWAGHDDPATVAINHVRPEAFSCLTLYALHRIKLIGKTEEDSFEGPGPQRFEEIVRKKIAQKLDKKDDPSWALHSIYGRHLWTLYWLDKGWVESNIDKIFPEEENDENIKYYVAAWDSFVIFNNFNTAMIEMLYPKYAKAIDNLSKGYKTETHLGPAKNLSGHLIWEYLISDRDVPAASGEIALLEKFFESVKPEDRGTACWVFWQILEDNSPDLDKYWQKARMFWEWRINRASMENNSTDFDAEMQWFAHFLLLAPPSETITSMWPLLEGLLPHITRGRHDTAWRSLEKYLVKKVESHPERSIQYFYLMHTQPEIPSYIHHGKEAKEIIETAAANKTSREKALALINVVASRLRNYKYRDIYERYA